MTRFAVKAGIGVLAGLMLGLLPAGLAVAAATDSGAAGKTHKKDVAEEAAFTLPKGTQLRPDQQEAFTKLKSEMEPKLRDAMAKVEAASSESDKQKAVSEVHKVREEIKKGIETILKMPNPTPPQNPNGQQQQQNRNRSQKRHR